MGVTFLVVFTGRRAFEGGETLIDFCAGRGADVLADARSIECPRLLTCVRTRWHSSFADEFTSGYKSCLDKSPVLGLSVDPRPRLVCAPSLETLWTD